MTTPVEQGARQAQQVIERKIAEELGVREGQVKAAVDLLDGGATVPFVARYRKEVTGSLDDAQLRTLEERLRYLRELEERRAAVLESIEAQGKLDDALRAQVLAADSKARLEDIYLPFKPKRRTKAQIAREAGLEPLADTLLADPTQDPAALAARYLNESVADGPAALEGARAILVERFGEDADLVGSLRERMWTRGRLVAKVRDGKEGDGAKFADYFDFAEPYTKLPSHRILAMLRGEKEEVLDLELSPYDGESAGDLPGENDYEQRIAGRFGIADHGRPADKWLGDTVRWAWRTRILVRLGIDLRGRLRAEAEEEAVRVFAANLRDLLLAAPAGTRATMGLDPGFRTGVKVAVVDATGKVVAYETIYPHQPANKWDAALGTLAALARKHDVDLVAIGNGTASRETDKLAEDLIKRHPELNLTKAMVSEAGASVYSASAFASQELPDLDVSIRGAVSIARRLQDPLAELVKIDPKSIGVGQYQHDLSEVKLSRSLDAVVEDCVNAVGVDVNTASAPLLTRVSGVTATLADNIVAHRDANGPFRTRKQLKDVARLGPKAFEQCAGFLRIPGGEDPLDASSVHPEAYPVVRRILASTGGELRELIGNSERLRALRPADFADDTFGVPTVTDILGELDKPGRDPRPAFRTAVFKEGVDKIGDLEVGMVLEGVVTNVAAFGAFVDVGVHQDGLVHVSALSRNFVKDPRDVVKPGDIVKVRVLSVDVPRKRIGLTLRLDDEVGRERGDRGDRGDRGGDRGDRQARPPRQERRGGGQGGQGGRGGQDRRDRGDRGDQGGFGGGAPANSAMADALRRARSAAPRGGGRTRVGSGPGTAAITERGRGRR
ncbi:Tex family protein, partial [Kitasatospora sp. NPDC101155]|uniref:Tex family protein n=1 Tax=Kitasatospora sp. NPDC101155 TaxID=3364097 RepID=UPI003816A180